jgi:hypothetical protein
MVQDMTTFRDAYPELVALTRSEDSQANAEAFFDKWATVDQYIYGVLQGHIHRGLFSPPDLKTYPETSRRLILDTPVRGESKYGLVHKIGGMHDSTMALTDDRIASSLAYFDRPVLRQYLDEVRKDSEELPETQRLMDEIAAYKGGYSRLSISVLVSNAGAKAISFSPDAVLYVNTAEAAGFEDNLPINIALFDEKGNLNPVTVNAGETKLLTFTSKTLVLNMTNWKSLLALFNQSARGCFMAIRSEGDEWGQNKILLSGNRQFGAVTAKDALTPAQIAAHFPQR